MGKWDIQSKHRPVKSKPNPTPEICRVVPPQLARVPDIFDWLFKHRSLGRTTRVAQDLKMRYREIGEMLKNSIAKPLE